MTEQEFEKGYAELEALALEADEASLDEFTETYVNFILDVSRGSTPDQLAVRKPRLQRLIRSQKSFVAGIYQERLREGREQAKGN